MDFVAALRASCPPVETARVAGWHLSRGSGGGRRASAARPLGEPGDPAPAIAAMAEWGERPVFMVLDGEDALDAVLRRAGLALEGRSVIYVGDTAALAYAEADVAVIACEGPLALHREIWAAGGIGPDRLALTHRVRGPRRWLIGRADDRPAAAAFVSIGEGAAVLNALYVLPAFRRRGVALRLTRYAAHWAAQEGAERLLLAVDAGNAPAIALYGRLGMREAGRYHYRTGPLAIGDQE